MPAQSHKVTFTGSQGEELAAKLELPLGQVRAYALFAHCFTCTKDIFAAARIASALAEHGIAVLRFDFTGLGGEQGRLRQHQLLLKRCRSGRRRRFHAAILRSAQTPRRAQPGRRSGIGCCGPCAGSQGDRHHWRTRRHTACRAQLRRGLRRDPSQGRSRSHAGRAPVQDQGAVP